MQSKGVTQRPRQQNKIVHSHSDLQTVSTVVVSRIKHGAGMLCLFMLLMSEHPAIHTQ